jgi:hypothetical protein
MEPFEVSPDAEHRSVSAAAVQFSATTHAWEMQRRTDEVLRKNAGSSGACRRARLERRLYQPDASGWLGCRPVYGRDP